MTTLKFTIIGRYEADVEDYQDASTEEEMADLDQDAVDSGEVSLLDVITWAADRDISVKIEVE